MKLLKATSLRSPLSLGDNAKIRDFSRYLPLELIEFFAEYGKGEVSDEITLVEPSRYDLINHAFQFNGESIRVTIKVANTDSSRQIYLGEDGRYLICYDEEVLSIKNTLLEVFDITRDHSLDDRFKEELYFSSFLNKVHVMTPKRSLSRNSIADDLRRLTRVSEFRSSSDQCFLFEDGDAFVSIKHFWTGGIIGDRDLKIVYNPNVDPEKNDHLLGLIKTVKSWA